MAAEQAAEFRIEALDRTARIFNNIDKRLDRVSKKVGKVGKAMTTALTLPVAAVGVTATKMTADFDTAMREVNSLLELPQSQFQKLKDDTRKLSVAMGTDLPKSANALYQAISAGVPKENALAFLEISSKTAIAGVTDTEIAVDGLTTVLNAFKLEASETERVADVMLTTVKRGKTKMDELSRSMFQAAPLASTLGIGFEEVAAATATLTKSGTPTSVAMTQIRQSMVALAKPNKDMIELLEKAGIESVETSLKVDGLQGTYAKLTKVASRNELAKAVGSVEALGAVLGVTGENAKIFAEDLDAVTNSAGAMQKAFEINNEGPARRFAELKVKLQSLAVVIGERLAPVVTQATEFLGDLADRFQSLDQALQNNIIKWTAIVAVIGPVLIVLAKLGPLFKVVLGVVGLLSKSIAFLIPLLVTLTIKMIKLAALNPFTALLVAVPLVIAGIKKITSGLDEIERPRKSSIYDLDKELTSVKRTLEKLDVSSGRVTGNLIERSNLYYSAIVDLTRAQKAFNEAPKTEAWKKAREAQAHVIKQKKQIIDQIKKEIASMSAHDAALFKYAVTLRNVNDMIKESESELHNLNKRFEKGNVHLPVFNKEVERLQKNIKELKSTRVEILLEIKGAEAITFANQQLIKLRKLAGEKLQQAQNNLVDKITAPIDAATERLEALSKVDQALGDVDEAVRLSQRSERQELKETEVEINAIRKRLSKARGTAILKGLLDEKALEKDKDKLIDLETRASTLRESIKRDAELSKLDKDSGSDSSGVGNYGSAISETQQKVESLLQSAKDLTATNRDLFNEEVDGWKFLLKQGEITQAKFDELRQASAEKFNVIIDQQLALVENLAYGFEQALTGAIDNFVDTGKFAFKDFAISAIKELTRVELHAQAMKFLGSFGGAGKKGSGLLGKIGGLFSFDGGGFTGGGPRSGGVDGKGGFPAILHPNETVVDHTRGQSMGGNITLQQTVVVRENVPSRMAQEIAEQGANLAIQKIKSYKQRGGRRAEVF